MATAQHVETLFSAALDDELPPAQEQSFHDHLAQCDVCSASYQTFIEAVGKVRALPKAAMPLPVHLPSEAPAAERATASDWLRRLIPRRLPMGAATGVAALAAVAIVVVGLTRGTAPAPQALATQNHAGTVSNSPNAAAGSTASCPIPAAAGTAPQFAYRTSASDRSRPGQQLLLSASDSTVTAGAQVTVYAVLTVPAQVAGAPGAAASAATTAITPCLSVTGAPGAFASRSAPAPVPIQGDQVAPNASAGDTVTIPLGTPSGSVVRVLAIVPANYPSNSEAPLTASLDITVR